MAQQPLTPITPSVSDISDDDEEESSSSLSAESPIIRSGNLQQKRITDISTNNEEKAQYQSNAQQMEIDDIDESKGALGDDAKDDLTENNIINQGASDTKEDIDSFGAPLAITNENEIESGPSTTITSGTAALAMSTTFDSDNGNINGLGLPNQNLNNLNNLNNNNGINGLNNQNNNTMGNSSQELEMESNENDMKHDSI